MPPFSRHLQIDSARLLLTPFSEQDADAAYPCLTRTLTRFMSFDPPANREAFDLVWHNWLTALDQGTDIVFAIRHRSDGEFLGLVGLHHLQERNKELGIWIKEGRHQQGFGRESVGAVARWASRELGITTFDYPVAEANHASRRIAESLGGVVVDCEVKPKYKAVIYQIPGQLAPGPGHTDNSSH